MTHCRLTKLSTRHGRPVSGPNGLTIKGYCTDAPRRGNAFSMSIYERDGKSAQGLSCLTTTRVVQVTPRDDGCVFGTLNSIYHLRRLPDNPT